MKQFLSVVAVLAVCFALSMTAFAATPTVKLPQLTAAPALAAPVRTVVMSDLPQMTAAEASASVTEAPRPRTPGFSDAQLLALRQQIREQGLAQGALAGTAGPRAGFTPAASKNFLGGDVTCAFVTPSDMGIAAGGTHVVQGTNLCLQVSTKTGGLVSRVNFRTFTGCGTCNFTDPRLTYDPVKKRYILVISSFQNNQATVWLAVTTNNNPTLGWFIFAINMPGVAGDVADYPTLGFDRNGIYIGINDFLANGGFTNQLWMVNKTQAYAGAAPTVKVLTGFSICTSTCVPVDTMQPVNVSGTADQPRTEYVVNSINGSTANLLGCGTTAVPCKSLVIWGITDPFGTLTVSGTIVNTPVGYVFSTGANEPGAAAAIETIDLRISGSVQYMGGNFYPTLCTNLSGPENTTLTFQVHPFVDGSARALVNGASFGQTLIYGDGGLLRTNGSAFFGTAQPDTDGDLLMVFAFSSDTDFPGVAYITHRTSEGDGKWNYGGGGLFLRSGTVFYNEGRWGDYSGTAMEYATAGSQINWWFSGMFSQNFVSISNSWATAIGKDAYTTFTQN
jgi:hypothetical protein